MFLDVNNFRENSFFSDVWLHFGNCFGKYFGYFEVLRYFGHFIGSTVILVILKVLELFWSF